jgi:acrylyl-CoA reductase (NADPH)
MRAFLVTSTTDGVTSGVHDVDPGILEGDILIAVAVAGVNFKDSMVRVPGNKVARRSPLIPGVDLAGTVLETIEGGPPIGATVIAHCHGVGVSSHGGFAPLARVPLAWVQPMPPGLDPHAAMILGTAGFTAMASLTALERHGLTPANGPLLVTGAAGGVGSTSVAIAAAAGYEVVASTGRAHEAPFLEGLGASQIIGRDEIDDRPERTLGTERWAGAIDCVGGATLTAILRSLHHGGVVAASGLTGGAELATTVFPFIVRAVTLLGIDAVEMEAAERDALWHRLAAEVPPAVIESLLERTVTLDGVAEALDAIAQGGVRGRIIVDLANES